MFKKIVKKNNKSASTDVIIPQTETSPLLNIDEIKQAINQKQKRVSQGIQMKPLTYEAVPEDAYGLQKEDQNEHNIKKVFIPEVVIKERTNDFLGVKREREEKMKEEKRLGLTQLQKEIYSLPEELKAQASNQDDYVDNLIKLSSAGIIDVPLPLKDKKIAELKNEKVGKEVECLKVLKKIGNASKAQKGDMSHKQLAKMNEIFENVFINKQGRKMKFIKEKMKEENKAFEEKE